MIPIRGLRAPVRVTPKAPEPYRHYTFRPAQATWTRANQNLLAEMWEAGVPVKEIAEKLGLSPSAVTGKSYRMGLPRRLNPVGGEA